MKRNTFLALLFIGSILVSCKKEPVVAPVTAAPAQKPAEEYIPTSANAITVPNGFDWANSRNVTAFISISSDRFPGILHLVKIYDGDPADGKLLGKGSVSDASPFKLNLFISNQIKNVTLVCIAPDNTKTTQKWALTDLNLLNTKLDIR